MPAGNRLTLFERIFGQNRIAGATSLLFRSAFGRSSRTGITVTPESARKNHAVLSCVNLIGDGVSQLPWGVYEETRSQGKLQRTEVTDRRISRILRSPNAFQTPSEFKKEMIFAYLLYGQSYTYIVRDASGNPVELIQMKPDDVRVGNNAARMPVYAHDNFGESIPASDVIHVKDIPSFGTTAKSRIEEAADLIGLLEACNDFAGDVFANGPNVPGILSSEEGLDEETRELLRGELAKYSSGKAGGKQGVPMVLEGGLSWSATDHITPTDADLRLLRQHYIDQIAALFRVPSYLIGGDGDEKYNNVGQKLSSMYRDTYAPIITAFEEALTPKLITNPDMWIRFDTSALQNGDRQQMIDSVIAQREAGLITINEGRAILGYSQDQNEISNELRFTPTPGLRGDNQDGGSNGDA